MGCVGVTVSGSCRGQSRKVHQTGHVAADQQIGMLIENVIQFQCAHFSGNVRESDREGSAETAALLGLAEGQQCDVLNR